VELFAEGRSKMHTAFTESSAGIVGRSALGAPMTHSFGSDRTFQPSEAQILEASKHRGRPQPHIANVLRGGQILDHGTAFIRDQAAQRWSVGTNKNRHTAVKQFKAFLAASNMTSVVQNFPVGNQVKTLECSRKEENLLGVFGMLRVMAGISMAVAESYIALIRTWHEWHCGSKLGIKKGTDGACGGAVNAVRSLRECFPPKDPEADTGKSPVTLEILKALVIAAVAEGNYDMAAAMVLAFNGLCCMGEITATSGAFDYRLHLAETDVTFMPSFDAATHVSIRIGASKADQDGDAARHHPRMLPVTTDFLSVGRWLQMLFRRRFDVGARQPFPVDAASRCRPLFQNSTGGHLKERTVLSFVRKVLTRDSNYSTAAAAKCGTHSSRIGGFTRYFHLGAPIEILKRMGGWSSDAWLAYLRFQRENGMKYSAMMCREEA
jgi:hypothetical protein